MKNNLTYLENKAKRAMMDPHFIFNVINSIQHFINSGLKEEANLCLTDFAKLIRLSSGFAGKSHVSLEEELTYLQLYLSFEKLRFGENLNYTIEVARDIDPARVLLPVMMIQPFLENAIWHGLLPAKLNGELSLFILRESKNILRIRVEDSGMGIPKSYLSENLLNLESKLYDSSVVIQRLKLLNAISEQKLFLSYRHVNSKLKHKGTVAEFLMPVTAI